MSLSKSTSLFGILILFGVIVGGMMVTYLFFGVVTLIGFIALVESIGPLKWLIQRTSKIFDVLLFIGTITATASLGPTITASLTIAGLGFTLVYAPILRQQYNKSKSKKK